LLTTLVLAGALLASPRVQAEKWDIKAGLMPSASVSYSISSAVSVGGEEHTATFIYMFETKAAEQDKPLAATLSWKDGTLENGQSFPDTAWDVKLDSHGLITDADGDETSKKTLMPFVFVYPDNAVAVGDTWSETVKGGSDKDDRSMTADMKADSMDKVGDVDVMKVTETLTQKGDDGLKCTGTWWVDKSGKVLKFDVTYSNWEVAMVPGQMLDGHMTGSIAK